MATVSASTVASRRLARVNGAGTSTLMASVVGQVAPDAGRIDVLGSDRRTARRALWARVAHLIEHPFAYPALTVREHIAAAARLDAIPKADADRAAAVWIERFVLDRWAATPARSDWGTTNDSDWPARWSTRPTC